MTAIFQEIDFHVVALLLLLLVLAAFLPHLPWVLIVLAIVPQGRILTRALHDYTRFKRPAAGYLIANETTVVTTVFICLMIWRLSSRT
jgi:hypothetical protein